MRIAIPLRKGLRVTRGAGQSKPHTAGTTDRAPQSALISRSGFARVSDVIARSAISLLSWSAIIILLAIAAFLLSNSIRALREVGLLSLLGGSDWYPTSGQALFGFLPAESGSVWITALALLLAAPIGIMAALYLTEFASHSIAELAKTLIEFMAAIPSVVFGLMGLTLIVPLVQKQLHLDSGLTALSAGLVVGIVCLPTIISISEDALRAVPDTLRQGSLALGNTRWQTACKVVIPAASSGLFAALMLGLGRAIGETMVVLMLAGNAGLIVTSPFEAARSITGTIAQETGEVVRGGLHFSVLFAMGLVLFVVTFLINLAADVVLQRQRKQWRR
jgi:phosphate transport system permease protein